MEKSITSLKKMGYRKKVGTLWGVTSFVSIVLLLLLEFTPSEYFWRRISYSTFELILEPLFYATAALSLSLAVLYFLPKAVYDIWWKFAVVYIPVCIVLFTWLADSGGGFGLPSFTPPDGVAMFFSALYLIITTGIIIVGLTRAKKW